MSEAGPTPGTQQAQPDIPVGVPPGLPRGVALSLMAVPIVHGIGQSLIFAILPAIARDLGISDTRVALVYLLPAIAWSLITAWWGRQCDVRDRKPILLLSLIGFALSTLIFAGAASIAYAGFIGATTLWILILASRLLYSLLSSGALPSAQAYLVEVTAPHRRAIAMGRLTASWNLGTMMGPALIGLLTAFGVLTPLFATALLAMFIWAWVRRSLTAQPPPARPADVPPTRLSVFDPRIRSVLLIGLCASTAQATMLQTLGYYFMDRIGVATLDAPRIVGIALTLAAICTLFSQTVLVQRLTLSPRELQRVGLGINVLAFSALALSNSMVSAWIATAFTGLAYGLLRPGNITQASMSVRAHEQGAVAGLNGAVWSAGFIVTPLIAMPLHQIDPRLPYVAALCVLATALTGDLWSRHRQRRLTARDPASP